jgi:AcrR family transcriptional regulator
VASYHGQQNRSFLRFFLIVTEKRRVLRLSDQPQAGQARADQLQAGQARADQARADQARRPRADAERNRGRLLDAARAAFASGQSSVPLDQIARDAGVGIGTLYRHFPTREALVEALYRKELDDLCASAAALLATRPAEAALRAWMDRFADYVAAKREMADALRAVYASGAVSVSQARERLTVAVQAILDAGSADGTLRADVRADDVVAMIVGMFTATSAEGGREQLRRMFELLIAAVRPPGTTRSRGTG